MLFGEPESMLLDHGAGNREDHEGQFVFRQHGVHMGILYELPQDGCHQVSWDVPKQTGMQFVTELVFG